MEGDRPLEQKELFDEFQQSEESQPAQQKQEALSASAKSSMPHVIRLYPRSWLYNAAVVGFLICCQEVDQVFEESWLQPDGTVRLPRSIFEKIDVEKFLVSRKEKPDRRVPGIISNQVEYPNFIQARDKEIFRSFIPFLSSCFSATEGEKCSFCYSFWINLDQICICFEEKLNQRGVTTKKGSVMTFVKGITRFNLRHNPHLAGSDGEFPNAFWAGEVEGALPLCPFCAFFLIHHHFAFCELGKGEKIFIQAPSFGLMYWLNCFVRHTYGQGSQEVRQILAMSLVEFARKMQVTLGRWARANIEVVVVRRKNNETIVDFYSLPQLTVELLSHRKIASLLHEIGELQVLELVLEGKFHQILEYAHRLLRIGGKAKSEQNKADRDFLTSFLKREENRRSPLETAQKMLELYGFLEEQRRKV